MTTKSGKLQLREKDPRTAKNWDFLNLQDKDLWLHAYHAWLGKGHVQ